MPDFMRLQAAGRGMLARKAQRGIVIGHRRMASIKPRCGRRAGAVALAGCLRGAVLRDVGLAGGGFGHGTAALLLRG